MATFNALTNEQKQIIREQMRLVRVKAGELARLMNGLAEIKGVYDATTAPVVALLDAGATIGDNSDLAGAVTVAKEDLTDLMADITAILAAYNTTAERTKLTKFAGIPNMLGGI
jgi:hypothetical protein